MFAQNAAKAYSNVNIETGVSAASPARLVVMLYDGAILQCANAERHMAARQIAEKGRAISHAITIIDTGLRGCLNLQSSPLAGQLDQLYEYMSRRLLLAGTKNDVAALREVSGLLIGLRSAWAEVADTAARKAVAARNPAPSSVGLRYAVA